jgi:5-methylcytosine-specific restriction protein A
MPSKPLKPCNKLGCPNLTRDKYCEIHKQLTTNYDNHRGTAAQRGYGSKWRKVRAYYLAKNPICLRCGDIATVVDHITPHKGNMQLFWATTNWQPLCKPCHDRKTATEDSNFTKKRH